MVKSETTKLLVELPLARKPRWYMPTPGKFVALLLLSVVVLYLSDHYDWFAFNKQKGWTVLIAVACVVVGLGLIVVWSAGAWLCGRRVQFGLLVLLLMVPTVAVPLAWLTSEVRQAKQAADAVRQIEQNGGRAYFFYRKSSTETLLDNYVHTGASAPQWLKRLFGKEFFGDVTTVHLEGGSKLSELTSLRHLRSLTVPRELLVSDGDLEILANFPQLDSIIFWKTEITDVGLKKLQSISTLTEITIFESYTSDHGCSAFEKALAGKCKVFISNLDRMNFRKGPWSNPSLRDPPYQDRYSLEYIGPSAIDDIEETWGNDVQDDSPPPPPPPVGKGFWPHAKSGDPLQD